MKKILFKLLPLFLLTTVLNSCDNSVTITLDGGLGYFTEVKIQDLQHFDDFPLYTERKIKVTRGTKFSDLNFDLSYCIEPLISTLFWSDNANHKIDVDFVFDRDMTITAQYYSNPQEGIDQASSTYLQGAVGAIKRRLMDNKPFNHIVSLTNRITYEFHNLKYAAPAFSLSKAGAALADACGETCSDSHPLSVFISLFDAMSEKCPTFNNQCGCEMGDAYQGIIGAIKRIFLYNKPYDQAWWENYIRRCTDAVEKAGPGKARYLAACQSALADQIGETGLQKETLNEEEMVDFIFQAFAGAKEGQEAFGLFNVTRSFITAFKIAIVNNKKYALAPLYEQYKLQVKTIIG